MICGVIFSVGRIPLDISILLTYEEAGEPSPSVVAMRRPSDDKCVNTLQRLRIKLSYGSKKKRKGAVVNDADLVPLEVMGVDNSKLVTCLSNVIKSGKLF